MVGLFLLFFMLTPAVVSAAANDQLFGACTGEAAKSAVCQSKGTTENPVTRIINVAANIIALLTGVGAVIMIIIAGFTFVTAGGATPGQRAGDPNAVANAKRRITYSIVALLVVALAWAATRFITARVIQ